MISKYQKLIYDTLEESNKSKIIGQATMVYNNKKFIFQINENNEFLPIKVKVVKGVHKGKEILISSVYCSRSKDHMTITMNLGKEDISIDLDCVEQIRDKTKKDFTRVLRYKGDSYSIKVKIRGRRTTVKLLDGIKGSVYCNIDDIYNENDGIDKAFKKALVNQLLKDINK